MKIRTLLAASSALALISASPVLAQGVDPVARGLGAAALSKVASTVLVSPGTGSAASNSASINAALAKAISAGGGAVNLSCPGISSANPGYLGATLVIGSATTLSGPGCYLKAASSIGNVLTNYALNQPWITTQLNASGTSGPFSLIWGGSTPAWVASTAITTPTTAAAPVYETSSGNIYYLTNTSTCTTGSTALTGTGAGISDGNCVWNYVTTNQASPNSTFMTATVYYPNHGLSANQAVFLTPEPDGAAAVAWAAGTAYVNYQIRSSNGNLYVNNTGSCTSGSTAPSGTGTVSDGACSWTYSSPNGPSNYNYFWSGFETGQGVAGGYADSAYFGVFPIYAVNDSNWLTIILRRQPASAFSGIPMWIKQADQNITVNGPMVFDYNTSANTPSVTNQAGIQTMDTVFSGVQNLTLNQVAGADTTKYLVDLNGISNATVSAMNSSNLPNTSDCVKLYGPAFDVTFRDISCSANDDVLSLQAIELPPFSRYTLASGDIIGTHVTHINNTTGLALSIYLDTPNFVTDQTLLDDVDVENLYAGSRSPIAVFSQALGTSKVTLGPLHIKGARINSSNQCVVQLYQPTNTSFMELTNIYLEDVESNWSQNATLNPNATGCIFQNYGSNTTVDTLVLDKVKSQLQASFEGNNDSVIKTYQPTSYITNLSITNSNFTASAAGNGWLYFDGSGQGVTTRAKIDNNYVSGLNGLVIAYNPIDVTFSQNYITSTVNAQVLSLRTAGIRAHFNSNYLNNIPFGLVRYNGVFATSVFSDGGNYLGGTSVVLSSPGTSNANLVGSAPVNVIDGGVGAVPTINSCGSGATITTGSNAFAGSVSIPSGVTSCVLNIPSGAWAFPPRGVQSTDQTTGITATASDVYNGPGAAGTLTIAGAAIGGTTVNYEVSP